MFILLTNSVALRSKVSVCKSPLLGSGSSNPVESMDVCLLCICCADIGLCDELNTHSEESDRLFVSKCECACVCVCMFVSKCVCLCV